MEHKTMKACQACGEAFYGSPGHFYCPACANGKKLDTVIRTRICQECGSEFLGNTDAKRCLKCAVEARKEWQRKCRKQGVMRPIRNIHKCIVCGKEYSVKSGI